MEFLCTYKFYSQPIDLQVLDKQASCKFGFPLKILFKHRLCKSSYPIKKIFFIINPMVLIFWQKCRCMHAIWFKHGRRAPEQSDGIYGLFIPSITKTSPAKTLTPHYIYVNSQWKRRHLQVPLPPLAPMPLLPAKMPNHMWTSSRKKKS
jgi:hypothetical protein